MKRDDHGLTDISIFSAESTAYRLHYHSEENK